MAKELLLSETVRRKQVRGGGRAIDSHDIVIRFNNIYKHEGYEKDYGTKTDIWLKNYETMKNFALNLEKNLELNEKIPIVGLKLDYWHGFVDIEKLELCMKNCKKICTTFSLNEIQVARNLIGNSFHQPTIGYLLVSNIYHRFKNFDNIDFYGFSFLEDNFRPAEHFFEEIPQEKLEIAESEHNFFAESTVMKRLVQNKQFSK